MTRRSLLPRASQTTLDLLYRRHARWLGGLLRRQLGAGAEEADDLVQESYLRIARYDDEAAARHPRALLRQIAINLARDHMRRNVIRGGLARSTDELDEAQTPIAQPEQESDLLLKTIILSLPDHCRDVFLLSRFTGMTNEEIARHLEISIKTVEARMSKALALCTQYLRD